MNERIKQLKIQACKWASENVASTEYENATDKKFAEFIVIECCHYLKTEAERLYALSASEHRPNFKENFEICAEKCYDNIQGLKEHFGVEG